MSQPHLFSQKEINWNKVVYLCIVEGDWFSYVMAEVSSYDQLNVYKISSVHYLPFFTKRIY